MVFMKKLKAHFLRWLHLMKCLIKLQGWHCAYSEGTSITFLGVEVWFVEEKIACTCGKTWYKK